MPKLNDKLRRMSPLNPAGAGSARRGGAPDRLRDLANFGSNPGALRARYYVPDGLEDGAALVVVLHGCTQTAAAYDHGSGWSRLADAHGFAVLFPEQAPGNNPNGCFNWFVPDKIGRNGTETRSIQQMIERMRAELNLDAARCYVTGLSAGGAMTMAMLASYPELFAGGAVIAGLPFGTATSMPQAFQRMRGQDGRDGEALADLVRQASPHAGPWPALSVWHGDADATVSPANAALIVAQWRALHGLAEAPDRTERVDGHPRRVWLGADGREAIEEIIVAGLGHGTPLSTRGDESCGNAGAYMLEAGISSTRHIARFWGLIPAGAASAAAEMPAPAAKTPPRRAERMAPPPPPRPEPQPGLPDLHGIQATIERALRSAGLMK